MFSRIKHLLLLLFLVSTTFLSIHLFFDQRFFFADDTVSYFLPYAKLQGDIVFNDHQLPQINFFNYLGHPILSQGQTGVFYLPRYVFYLIAQSAHNFELIVPLEIFFHILVAACGMYFFLSYLKFSQLLCVIGSYAYAFNGVLFEVGRNWFMVPAYFAYMPFLYLFLLQFVDKKKNVLWLVLIRTIIFYVGYTNFFVYIVFFEIVMFVFLKPARELWYKYIFSFLLTSVLILPLLVPIVAGLLQSPRTVVLLDRFTWSNDLWSWMAAFYMLPCSSVSPEPCGLLRYHTVLNIPLFIVFAVLFYRFLKTDYLKNQYVVEAGQLVKPVLEKWKHVLPLVFVLFFLLFLVTLGGILLDIIFILLVALFFKRRDLSYLSIKYWLLLFLLALLLSFGLRSLFTLVFYPIIHFFRGPWKWYLPGQFFFIVFAVFFIQRYFQKRFLPLLLVFIVLFSYVLVTYFSFNYNPRFKAYSLIQDQSIISMIDGRQVGVNFSRKAGIHTDLLTNNIGAYYGMYTINGYDPLVSKSKDSMIQLDHLWPTIETDEQYNSLEKVLEGYRVSYYIVDKANESNFNFLKREYFQKVYENSVVSLYKDKRISGLIITNTGSSLSFVQKGNSIEATVNDNQEATSVIFPFLNDGSNWRAFVDNKPVGIQSDEYKRIVVPITANARNVRIEYKDSLFFYGLYVTGGILLLLIVGVVYANYFKAKKS